MAKKYNFREIKDRCLRTGEALPVDVNVHPETEAAKLKRPALMDKMKSYREGKQFGFIRVIMKHPAGTFYEGGKFEYQFGMCNQFVQTEIIGDVICEHTILNENLDMKKRS